MAQRIRRATLRKRVGSDKDRLVSEAKLYVQAKQNKELIPCSPGRQMFSHFQESRASAITTNVPLSSSFPPAVIAQQDAMWNRIPLPSVGVSQLCPLPVPMHLLAAGVVGEAERALTLCKHCSAVTKTLVRHQHCWGRKSKTWHHTSHYEEKELHCSKTEHRFWTLPANSNAFSQWKSLFLPAQVRSNLEAV